MNAPAPVECLLPGLDHQHLDALEEEAVFILREVAAAFERPAPLFSGGKDSCVLLRLAEKAFKNHLGAGVFEGRLPFPLLHASTGSAATLAWLDTEAAVPGRKYWLRHGNRWGQARLAQVRHRIDVHTLGRAAAERMEVNDIGDVVFDLQQALPLAPYAANRVAGALVVVDAASHRTSGALLVTDTGLPS